MKPCLFVRALPGALVFVLLVLTSVLRATEADIAPIRAKAEKGNAVAQYNLGLIYAEGRAVAKDPVEAYVWLSLAAENGTTGKALGVLTGEMSADQLQAAKIRLNERRIATPTVISLRPSAPARAAAPPFASPSVTPASPPPEVASATPAAPAVSETSPAAPAASPPAEDRIAALEKELVTLNADKTKLSEEVAAAWKEADSAKATAAAAEQHATLAEAALSQRAKDIIVLQTERSQLRQQLAEAPTAATVVALQQDRDKLAGRLATANADMQSLHERLARLESENEKLQQTAAGAAQSAASVAALHRERDEQAKALAAAQAGMAELTTQLEAVRKDLTSSQSVNTDLTTQVKTLTGEKTALAAARQEQQLLEAELAKEGRQAGELEKERDQLRTQLASAEAAKSAAAQQADEAARLKIALTAAEQRATQAETARDQRGKDLTAAQAELENSRRTVGELTAAKSAAVQAATTAGQDRRERDDLRQQLESARQELAAAKDAGEKSAAALTQATEHRQTAEAKLAEQSAQLAALATERDQLHQQLASAAGAAKTDASHLQDQATTLTRQLESTSQELVSAKAAGADLAAQVKKLAGEKDALNHQLAERGEAAQSLTAVTGRLDDARKELLVLKNSNTELNDNLQAITKERDRLRGQVVAADAMKTEAARLQDEVTALTRQLDAARKDLASAQSAGAGRAGESTRQLADLNTRLQQTQQELEQAHTQNASLTEANQRLERQDRGGEETARRLQEAQTSITGLQKENDDLKSEHATLTARLAQAASTASTAAGSAGEVAHLKDELGKANLKVDVTVRAFALAQQENEQLKKQIEQSAGELAAARDAAGKAAADNASLREFLRQTQNTGASLASENARLRTALAVAGRAPAVATLQPTRPAPVTVAPAAPAAPAPAAPPPAPRTYRVVSGDTLSRISSRYYGTAARWQDIYNANRDQLRSPDVLPLGVELKIP